MSKRVQPVIIMFILFVILNAGCGEEIQDTKYFFEVSNDENLMIGTSKILNIVEIGPNMSEDAAKVQGQLLTLFGEPAFTSKDFEIAYTYVIIANTSGSGANTFVLTTYSGPSGPAIGGEMGVDDITEAAEKLKEYILAAHPSDYEYEGYYFDGPTRIHQGVKDGQVFFSETAMSDEEFDKAYRELYLGN